eukprot:g7310.t1
MSPRRSQIETRRYPKQPKVQRPRRLFRDRALTEKEKTNQKEADKHVTVAKSKTIKYYAGLRPEKAMSGKNERKATPELTRKQKAALYRLRKKMMNDLESWGVGWLEQEADVPYWDTVEALWESVRVF